MLDVGLLQAGASMKGEFEQRLRSVIDEVQASPKPIILFIDETHTLVGAGGAAGTGDAANLLKPALARGQLRTIGATTWAEYKKHIEKDPALTRRFQTVQVDEPDEPKAILMMRGVASAGEAPQGADPRRGAGSGRQAVAPLHPGAPAARQERSACSTPPAPAWRSACTPRRPRWTTAAKRIEALETEQGIIAREAIGIDTGRGSKREPKRLAEAAEPNAEATLGGTNARWSTNALAARPARQTVQGPEAAPTARRAGGGTGRPGPARPLPVPAGRRRPTRRHAGRAEAGAGRAAVALQGEPR